ncbi:YjgP/YjgQ family permease, partial [bacterium]|nr:YjgP/YjgQ family permease [bacterium]
PEGWKATLELADGKIHRTLDKTYTQISFETYSVKLFDPHESGERSKSPQSMTTTEVRERLQNAELDEGEKRKLGVEFHRRWSLPFACLVFGLIGVSLGTTANRRNAKSSGFVLCLIVIVSYWISYVVAEGLARNGFLPPWVTLWLVNLSFLAYGVRKFRTTE